MIIYLDVDVRVGLERKRLAQRDGGGEWNRMDREEVAFHLRVREGYLQLARDRVGRWRSVDASQPAEAVHEAVLGHVLALVASHQGHPA
jgi:dTMP kinase